MKNCKLLRSLLLIFILIPCIAMALFILPSESADFTTYSTYCQYPPYVFQSKLPNVMILVSNSYSMSGFAYQNNTADNVTNASGGFIPGHNYYGLFDPRYWYQRTNTGWTKRDAIQTVSSVDLSPTSKPNDNYWHGSFLNWLTMRRVDVMKKLLTGASSPGGAIGYQSCSSDNTLWKKFTDDQTYTEVTATGDIYVKFSHDAGCNGNDASNIVEFFTVIGGVRQNLLSNSNTLSQPIKIGSYAADEGIIQRNLPKAQIGLAFYDVNGDGANIVVPVAAAWGQADYNRLKTPSLFNNSADQPVADALFTIAGYFAQVNNSNSLFSGLGGGCTDPSTSTCGPIYTTAYPIGRSTSRDPFFQHDHLSTCTKANVIVISDGEPCSDGNLPTGLATYARDQGSPFTCDISGDCDAAPGFSATTGLPACTPRSPVSPSRNKGSLEDVALWAHTTDLRNDTALPGKQELDIWIVRAFGLSTSNLLKYAAINGSFTDNGSGVPVPGSYDLSTSYFEATDPYAIEAALNNIFQQLLKRATSGTAASVLASGQGSGANLVQAVFYPKRRFGDQIIDWTGSLSNFWYYIDPLFGNSSILEDSNKQPGDAYMPILNLGTDRPVTLYFDQSTQTTKALIGTSTTGVPFEEVKSLWEAGAALHDPTTSFSRKIFTAGVEGSGNPLTATSFTTGNAGTLRNSLGAADDVEASAIIEYVRGSDSIYRQRQVLYKNVDDTGIDNTVWKLGDIINSTPKIVSSVPLNTYNITNKDASYRAFIKSDTYKKRGMVFAGANDGMLHAFKLGRLLLPGDNNTIFPPVIDQKAKLYNDNTLARFGSEQWAYIPRNALPYLKAMLDNNYCHLYYVDQTPTIFDASIGGADTAVRPLDGRSWRTILIGGMRLGGACRDYAAGATNVRCASTNTDNNCVASPVSNVGLSSYFALDVTNPEVPTVLWEFTDNTLGFTTTGPSIVRVNELTGTVPDQTLNGKWYVIFGSGPTGPITNRQFMGKSDQTLKLFILDLKTGTLQRTISSFNDNSTTPVPITKAFAGSMINATADFELDYQDDVVYIPYVQDTSSTSTPTWDGGVVRLQMNQSRSTSSWSASVVTKGVGPVTSAVVRLQSNTFHTNWLYFGAGRYYFSTPLLADDSTAPRFLFGMKDTCFTSVNTYRDSCNDRVSVGSLTPIGDSTVDPGEPPFGWSIALDGPGAKNFDGSGPLSYHAERVVTDPTSLTSGNVIFTSFLPYGDECSIGGRTFLWAVRYDTGTAAPMKGMALVQTSTASIEQVNLDTAFSYTPSGVNAGDLHRGGRRTYSIEGLTGGPGKFFVPPPPVKRILHMKER